MSKLSFLVFLLSIAFVSPVAADCPDRPTKCNTATYGWQGTCAKGLSCKDCGPKHCPQEPKLKVAKAIALRDGSGGKKCRENMIDRKYKPDGESACSIPARVKNMFGMANLVFGKSACAEHDICYAMKGMNRKLCDTMFLDNMLRSCNAYYYGHLGDRNLIKVLNVPGHASCKAAANIFHTAVVAGGASSFNPSNGDLAQCKGASGPPRLGTNLYLSEPRGDDRIYMKSKKGGSDKAGKVKVCLKNYTKQWKGMHYKKSSKPKYVAKNKNDTSCGHYWPGHKTFYFWEKAGFPAKKTARNQPIKLDIRAYADYRITFYWSEDS